MKKWRFIANQNSTIVGINDAGIETFTANMNRSLIREIIQNSLDAVIPGSKEPVQVDFELFTLDRDSIPDIENLHSVILKCRDSNQDEPDAFKFFEDADKIMRQPRIDVLRISDHNTIGLEGSDTCKKGTSWSRLVKENGSSNKGQSSGGSFGIGKSAAFACSDLRTIFYSSLDTNQLKSNFGVAKLVSYQDDQMGWTTGIGYYSEDERFVAIPELAEFDNNYRREDSGTDIYVLGMHKSEEFKETFVKAVLLDFLVSFVKGKLIVNVQGEKIDQESLPKYMAKMNPYESDEIKDLLGYYHLLSSSDPQIVKISLDSSVYGKKYGFDDGECTLYLKENEGYNRKVLITRNAGMRILEQNRISGSIEFTGVMIIEGEKMNKTFKAMEVPSHDAWEPGRCRDEQRHYTNVLSDFKRYIKECVLNSFGKVNADAIDAIGASDFIPDKIQDDKEQKLQKNNLSTRINKLSEKSVEPTKKKAKAIDISEAVLEDEADGGSGPGEGPGPQPGSGPHPGPGPGPYPGSGPDPSPKDDKTGDDVRYREVTVKKRLVCTNIEEGRYSLSFVSPFKTSKGKLVFSLAGEQNDFKLPIHSAKVISGDSGMNIEKTIGNQIYLSNLTKGDPIKLEVKVDFDSYCMMEVDYYANKNRLSPYPILDNFGDDYVDSSFTVDYEVDTRFSEVYGKLMFRLENEDIQGLIADKKAVYTVHIESPSTCYRKVYTSDETELEFRLEASLLSKVIEIRTFIILTQEIRSFSSKRFHPDYQGQTFHLQPHQIIAIGTAKNYDIKKDDRDLDSLPSILRIVKSDDRRKGSLSVNTDNDRYVVIGLSEKVFERYARLGKNTFKASAFSLVLLPALIVVTQRMYNGKDDEAINSMHWYKVIESLLNDNGYSIEDISIDNDSLLTVCQAVFADPIAKSFKELDAWSERM